MEAFKTWLRSNGFWWNEDAIELGSRIDEGGGEDAPRVGVKAKRDIEICESVARIPSSACFTCENCAHADAVRKVKLSAGEDEWLASLGTALVLERTLGSSSRWNAYLDSLPHSEPDVVMMWSEDGERRRYLCGTDIEQSLRDERAAARTEWTRHVKPVLDTLRGAAKDVGFDDFLAARSVASSRAFTVNPRVGAGLVPIADLFNHRTGGHHVYLSDARGTAAVSERDEGSDDDALFVRVVKASKAGEEVFNTYGELGNAKLLCSYGFAQLDNPADKVTIGVPALRAAAALRGVSGAQIATRLAWCDAIGLCDDETTFELRLGADPPDVLLLVSWVLASTDDRFDAVRAVKTGGDETSIAAALKETIESGARGGLKDESALGIILETLRRRRGMYVSLPHDGDETATWKSSLSILLDSERAIISGCERYLEQHGNATDAESKRRKVESPSEDAFNLFD